MTKPDEEDEETDELGEEGAKELEEQGPRDVANTPKTLEAVARAASLEAVVRRLLDTL